jgi:hypothetical protein
LASVRAEELLFGIRILSSAFVHLLSFGYGQMIFKFPNIGNTCTLAVISNMNSQIIAVILTGLVTIVSLIASNYFIRKKEDRTRRLQIKMEYISKQIEEFYGPLYSFLKQIRNYRDVREIITLKGSPHQDKEKIVIFFREEYVAPLNEEIRELIKTKFHLIEGKELPESFKAFLVHATQLSTQIRLWKELQMDTREVLGTPAPLEFEVDVKKTLLQLMKKYDDLLKELE